MEEAGITKSKYSKIDDLRQFLMRFDTYSLEKLSEFLKVPKKTLKDQINKQLGIEWMTIADQVKRLKRIDKNFTDSEIAQTLGTTEENVSLILSKKCSNG